MAGAIKRSFDHPDEIREVPKARVEVVDLGGMPAMRCTFEPGWRWSETLKPIVGTDSCQVAHMGYMISGEMVCRMDDGSEITLHAGDAVTIPPGHDAWITGHEQCVFIDFQGAATYAKPQGSQAAA